MYGGENHSFYFSSRGSYKIILGRHTTCDRSFLKLYFCLPFLRFVDHFSFHRTSVRLPMQNPERPPVCWPSSPSASQLFVRPSVFLNHIEKTPKIILFLPHAEMYRSNIIRYPSLHTPQSVRRKHSFDQILSRKRKLRFAG